MPVSMLATVGGKTGAAQTITSAAIRNISVLHIDVAKAVLSIEYMSNNGPQHLEIDFVLTTTLTDSIASLVNTVVISGT